MRGYAKVAFMGMLMTGLLAAPNLSTAAGSSSQNENERHSLLNSDLRSKIDHLRDNMVKHRHHGGVPASLEALQAEVVGMKADYAAMVANEAALLSLLSAANTQISTLDARLTARLIAVEARGGNTDPFLTQLKGYVKIVETGSVGGVNGPHVIFTGVNLHLRSGSNATNDNGSLSGRGNLIVGYNESQATPIVYDGLGCDLAPGSHNIVTGSGNLFTSYGGLVVGSNHCITSPNTSILAGDTNEAHGVNSAILGGTRRGTSILNQTVPVIR